MDSKDLKIQALLERMGQDKAEYESRIADLRVEVTLKEEELNSLRNRVADFETSPATEASE